jgi:hypothetical protein
MPKTFQKLGWVIRRNAHHIVLAHPNVPGVTLSIPNHKEVRLPLLKRQVQLAGITDKFYRQVFDS